ncbi:MAG: AraC family transcriptional regulator [Ruminococcaceae bacterium]|nr:AraC family transcriptional regulator [Oscillospiraceae bacterium]
MPILLDRQLREQIPHDAVTFPITFFSDELASLPDWAGPLHWHPDFEIASAECGVLDYQVGQQHIHLEPGDSIFVNGNVLHGIRQLSGDEPDPMPNIVFSGTLAAPETSVIYQKYILPVIGCGTLPFIVFRHGEPDHSEVLRLVGEIYTAFREQDVCFEMTVQRNISRIFEYICRNFESLPRSEESRIQLTAQIRIQKMLTYIYEHYADAVTLEDIAGAANISRSEAGRCFQTYMNCSPVDALIRHRLQTARRLLTETTLTLQEISYDCGFHSVNYFSRQFKKLYGYAPGKNRVLGK